mgnify:CR=1 FL=1
MHSIGGTAKLEDQGKISSAAKVKKARRRRKRGETSSSKDAK